MTRRRSLGPPCWSVAGIVLACTSPLLPAIATAAELPEATPADGPPFRAALVEVSPEWRLRFRTEDSALREIHAADLIRWGSFVDATAKAQILLVGGGLIVAQVDQIDKEQLRASARSSEPSKSPIVLPLSLPLEVVAGVVFHPSSDRVRRDQLIEQVTTAIAEGDRLILDNGDELTGTFLGLAQEKLTLKTDVGQAKIDVAKVAAIVFNPVLMNRSRLTGVRTWVGLADGSRLLAGSITADETAARLKLLGGVELTVLTPQIVALQPLGGRVVYVSDLKPSSYRHIPYLQLAWPYRVDRNVLGQQLRSGGQLFLKGLGVHSASRLTFDLDKPCSRLEAELAIDDSAGDRGSVVFRVFTDDGNGKWTPAFSSPVVRGGDRPVPMSVDVSGAKRISLLVDFADHGDELDHADWLNARLVR